MPPFIAQLSVWFTGIATRLKQRSWRTWAVGAVAVFVVFEAVRSRVSDASTFIVEYAWRWLLHLLAQPMGLGGLAVLGFVTVLLFVSWVDTRPKPKPSTPSPIPLSEAERRAVQDIRTVWQRHGVLAVSQLTGILQDTCFELKKREFWADLLEPVVSSSESSRRRFESALEATAHGQLRAVRDRFNAMYSDYALVMKWVALLQAKRALALGSRGAERFAVWRQNHRDFLERLRDLNEDPLHSGTLAYSLRFISEPEFREFLAEAEWSPDWLALMRESQGAPPSLEP